MSISPCSDTQYTTCENLITKSGGSFPGTSVKEIHTVAGVPLDKIVIGKPSAAYQAANGFVSFSTLATCIAQAGEFGWSAGTMFWEYENNLSNNLVTTLSKALGAIAGNGGGLPILSSAGPKTPTSTTKSGAVPTSTVSDDDCEPLETSTSEAAPSKTTTKSAAVPTTTSPGSKIINPGGDSCGDAKPWDANTIYTGGSTVENEVSYVTYEGSLYGNKWWSQGDKPTEGGDSNAWTKIKSCSASKRDALVEPELSANISRARRSYTHSNKMRKSYISRYADLS